MLRERLGKTLLFLDGGMGTLLQKEGLAAGALPELWNIERPEVIQEIHRAYYASGSDIVLTNTFGANRIKFHDAQHTLSEVIIEAVKNARIAAESLAGDGKKRYVALDMGPTGKLLKPLGDLSFEEAYETFAEVVRIGAEAGVDCIHIETMSDTYEVKAAVLAAKEQAALPVFVTVTFDERAKLLTGGDVKAVVALLEGLRVDAIGMNCGMGPEQMLPILEEFLAYSSLPIIVKPNAGLPKQRDGETYYDVEPEQFGKALQALVEKGACVVGGCCGTTPAHIAAMVHSCADLSLVRPVKKEHTLVSSYGQAVELGAAPKIIGERINPTGKKRFGQALREHDLDYVLREGITQQEAGAHILDVNVGLPEIDEVALLPEVVCELQSVTSLPLQLDTVDGAALEAAMRIYNGKPMINSVNGKQESMDLIFPLVAKYGGVVVGLTLDEAGIPDTVEGRVAIAERILKEAARYGIDRKDIVIDVLALTISSDAQSARTTLGALQRMRECFGVNTLLGVSNISFGLPNRPLLNANFYTMALQNGLSAGIINPSSMEMRQAYDAYCALMGYDLNYELYLSKYAKAETQPSAKQNTEMDLQTAVRKGLKEEAGCKAKELLQSMPPLSIIQEHLVPALDAVGQGFEAGKVFLPQLLMSAEAAQKAFDVLKAELAKDGAQTEKGEKIVLATVKGDIHDIGKNIVKVLLQNYGFEVLDLGKDVPPEKVVETVLREQVQLVGLSALMTTTVTSMEETIKQLKKHVSWCKVMVGGAVLNQEYADMIGADFYGKDAMQSVYYAKEMFEQKR
ncbi:MAG: homocysteine S-methyltransferase family protein [Faecalimonas sp.]|nr:homocysteine S-methyltransferase family protein [Faecalimonas sp.]